jgi:hypothetical protein
MSDFFMALSDGATPNFGDNPILKHGWKDNPVFGFASDERMELESALETLRPPIVTAITYASKYVSTKESFESVASIEDCFVGSHMGHDSHICRSTDDAEAKYFCGGWPRRADGIQSFLSMKVKLRDAGIDCPPCGVIIMRGANNFHESVRIDKISLPDGFLMDTLYFELMSQWSHVGLEFWKPLPLELINGINSQWNANQDLRTLMLHNARSKFFDFHENF